MTLWNDVKRPAFVYVLRYELDSKMHYYVGHSADLLNRLVAHRNYHLARGREMLVCGLIHCRTKRLAHELEEKIRRFVFEYPEVHLKYIVEVAGGIWSAPPEPEGIPYTYERGAGAELASVYHYTR